MFALQTFEGNPLTREYPRSALMLGLEQGSKLGNNPFKIGLIGATDSHTSFAHAALAGVRRGALRHQDGSGGTRVLQERAYTSPIWYTL